MRYSDVVKLREARTPRPAPNLPTPTLGANAISLQPVFEGPPSLPGLKFDCSRLVTDEVKCGPESVLAVVDTGAAVTVISPQLLEKTQFRASPWTGPRIIMANGSPAHPIGSAHIAITHRNRSASGEAVVMGMTGIDGMIGKRLP